MPVKKDEILEATKDFRSEEFEEKQDEKQLLPDVVQETLTSSIVIHSGISLKATITLSIKL